MVAAVLIVAIAFIPFILPSDQSGDYSAYGSGTSGLSTFRKNAEEIGQVHSIITSPALMAEVDDPTECLYVAVSIEREYSQIELDVLVEFVKMGGSMLIADDNGYADDLAHAIAEASPEGTALGFTRRVVYSSDTKPLDSAPLKLAGNWYTLSLSSPTALLCYGTDTTIISTSSTDDFTDWDGDGRGEIGEVGKVTLASTFLLEGGKGVFIGDPDVLSDAMAYSPGMENFTTDLLNWLLPDGGTIYFDESRHDVNDVSSIDRNALGVLLATFRGAVSYLLIAVTAVVTAIVLVSRRDPEPWHHSFDLSGYRGSGIKFAKKRRMRRALKNELISRLEESTGLLEDDITLMGEGVIAEMINDPLLVKVYRGRNLSPDDTQKAVDKIRRWKYVR